MYTPEAVAAQKRRHEVSGRNRTFYCGAYWRYGFHEDGVVSAEWAVRDFNIVAAREQTLRGLRPAWAGAERSWKSCLYTGTRSATGGTSRWTTGSSTGCS